LRFEYKLSSELTKAEIGDILQVVNLTFGRWGDERFFSWKYLDNPYGDSLHMIAYDGLQPVGSLGFWRNDLSETPAYQCVDLAIVSSHQRQGIFQQGLAEGVSQLKGAYLYTYPNGNSRPGFIKSGWSITRRVPISLHWASRVIRHYDNQDAIPDEYAEWRFVQHPSRQYYVYRWKDKSFLLSLRRKHLYAVGGKIRSTFGLPEVHPKVLLSYDFPNHLLSMPRRLGYFLENPCYAGHRSFIPSNRSDTL